MFAWLQRISNRLQWPPWAIAVALIAVLAITGATVWNSYLKDHFIPKRLARVDEGLWRSGQLSASLVREVLESKGIGLVIDLTYPSLVDPDQLAEQEAIKELKIEHIRLPMDGGGEGNLNYYADALEALARAERENIPALVHCRAGSRRAAGIIASYQVLVQSIPPAVAYLELDRFGSRPVAESQLLPFLNENMEELAILLAERKVIDRVPDPLPFFRPPTN